jgi:hypothetical protein
MPPPRLQSHRSKSAVTTATAGGACVGEAHVITVSGEAGGATWEELDRALRAAYEDGAENVAVDLSKLDALEADSLEVVLRYVARFRARGGDVVLAGPAESAFSDDVHVERRVDDAVASLLSSGGRP